MRRILRVPKAEVDKRMESAKKDRQKRAAQH